jgi:hypothetical protein
MVSEPDHFTLQAIFSRSIFLIFKFFYVLKMSFAGVIMRHFRKKTFDVLFLNSYSGNEARPRGSRRAKNEHVSKLKKLLLFYIFFQKERYSSLFEKFSMPHEVALFLMRTLDFCPNFFV